MSVTVLLEIKPRPVVPGRILISPLQKQKEALLVVLGIDSDWPAFITRRTDAGIFPLCAADNSVNYRFTAEVRGYSRDKLEFDRVFNNKAGERICIVDPESCDCDQKDCEKNFVPVLFRGSFKIKLWHRNFRLSCHKQYSGKRSLNRYLMPLSYRSAKTCALGAFELCAQS